jgi:hypothetical protein
MGTELYSQGQIFADGQLVADATTVKLDFNTNDNPVFTLAKGFAGITPGAGQTGVSIDQAIPRAGYDYDWFQRAVGRTPVEIVAWRGSKKMNIKGFIQTIGEQLGVNQTSVGSIAIIGGEPTFS